MGDRIAPNISRGLICINRLGLFHSYSNRLTSSLTFGKLGSSQVGGGAVMTITAIVAYFQDKPAWLVVILAIAVGVFLVCVASILFRSYALKITETRRNKRLARLTYDVHKRISLVRDRLVSKTDWDKVDTSKVISPLLSIFGNLDINDSKISELDRKLSESGSAPSGIASVPDAIMGKSDTSLESALKKDFWYKVLLSRLDNYKPYPKKLLVAWCQR